MVKGNKPRLHDICLKVNLYTLADLMWDLDNNYAYEMNIFSNMRSG